MGIFFAFVVVIATQDPAPDGIPAGQVIGGEQAAGAEGGPDATPPASPDASLPLVEPEQPQPAAPPPVQAQPAQPQAPHAPPPPAAPQTQWQPLGDEVENTATGMLGVCETLILPISIIPAVGEYIGVAAEWACIVPAALAVENVALHHGDRAPHMWQIVGALAAQKLWQTLVGLPVPIVLVSVAVLGGIASVTSVYFALMPVGLAIGLFVMPVTATYLFTEFLEERGGRLIFSGLYGLFDEARMGEDHEVARKEVWLGPRQTGIPGALALVATAHGSDAPFRWPFLIPVVGPMLQQSDEAVVLQARMRRTGIEVLGERKDELHVMDTTVDVLTTSRGIIKGAGQASLLASIGLLATSYALWVNDEQQPAQVVGGIGAVGAVLAAALVAVAKVPEVITPCCVPAAYLIAPVVETYPDPRAGEIPPPPHAPDAPPPPAPASPAPAPAGAGDVANPPSDESP